MILDWDELHLVTASRSSRHPRGLWVQPDAMPFGVALSCDFTSYLCQAGFTWVAEMLVCGVNMSA